MVDDKLVKEIAEPIIKQLEELSKKATSLNILQIPKIKIMMDPKMEPIKFDGVEIDEEFLHAVEEYIQEELEMLNIPTVMH